MATDQAVSPRTTVVIMGLTAAATIAGCFAAGYALAAWFYDEITGAHRPTS